MPTAARLWLDALCVPERGSRGAQRNATTTECNLPATRVEVLVVLSEGGTAACFEECEGASLSEQKGTLERLETRNGWVSRFWTYQELARSQNLLFLVETGNTFSLSGNRFFESGWAKRYIERSSRAFPRPRKTYST